MKNLRQEIDITGVIAPNNWDENGKITEIAIYTEREEVYRVENRGLIQELMNLMHKQVEVKGKIRQRLDGNKSITIQKYSTLEETAGDKKKTD